MTVILHKPRKYLALGLGMTIGFAGVAAAFILRGDWGGVVFLMVAVVGLSITAEYLRDQHILGGETLRTRGSEIRFADLTHVRYIPRLWVRLRTPHEVVRVSLRLVGIDAFAKALLAAAPEGSMSPATRAALEAAGGV